jgi:hypothetical protein
LSDLAQRLLFTAMAKAGDRFFGGVGQAFD